MEDDFRLSQFKYFFHGIEVPHIRAKPTMAKGFFLLRTARYSEHFGAALAQAPTEVPSEKPTRAGHQHFLP